MEPIQAAKKDLAESESKVRDLEAQLRAEKEKLTRLGSFVETYEQYASGSQLDAFPQDRQVKRRPNTVKAQVFDIAREALALGGTVSTRKIVDQLEERGVSIGGKDKVLSVSKILSASDDFELKSRLEGWELSR